MFSQMESDTIQVIEMSHGFARKSILLRASCFPLPGHAGIVANRRAPSNQHNVLFGLEVPDDIEQRGPTTVALPLRL
jgi:hypothetical protein